MKWYCIDRIIILINNLLLASLVHDYISYVLYCSKQCDVIIMLQRQRDNMVHNMTVDLNTYTSGEVTTFAG